VYKAVQEAEYQPFLMQALQEARNAKGPQDPNRPYAGGWLGSYGTQAAGANVCWGSQQQEGVVKRSSSSSSSLQLMARNVSDSLPYSAGCATSVSVIGSCVHCVAHPENQAGKARCWLV
jgi:hypothetical protein